MSCGDHWMRNLLPALVASVAGAQMRDGAPLVELDQLPLNVSGRWITDRFNERVKWACANWHGLEQRHMVPGGLQEQRTSFIAKRIVDMGFNCVRVPISVQAVLSNPEVNMSHINFTINSDLEMLANGTALRWTQMFDYFIDKLSAAKLMIILDRHMLLAGNNPGPYSLQSRLWYGLGFSRQDNIDCLVALSNRTRTMPYVVAFDLINEPADYAGTHLTWGDGNETTDLHLYYTTAGNAVLAENPNLLVVAEGMCVGKLLYYLRDGPQITLNVKNRLVHSAHAYSFFTTAGVFSTNAGNFENALMRNWSWPFLGELLLSIWAGLTLILVGIIFWWRKMGKPRPYPSTFVMVCCTCVIIQLLIGLTIEYAAYNFNMTTGGCKMLADREILPKVVLYAVLVVFFIVLTLALGICNLWSSFHPTWDPLVHLDTSKESSELEAYHEVNASVPDERGISIAGGSTLRSMAGGSALHERKQATPSASNIHHAEDPSFTGPTKNSKKNSRSRMATRTLSAVARLYCDDSRTLRPVGCRGMLLLCSSIAFATIWTIALYMGILSFYWSSWSYAERTYDRFYGFALEEGRDYTAPMFIGEFGHSADSEFFQRFVRYAAAMDLDWAYWPLNPMKPDEGMVGSKGFETEGITDPWKEDTWSILHRDWAKIRYPFLLHRLRAIQRSPATMPGRYMPCNRAVNKECGD